MRTIPAPSPDAKLIDICRSVANKLQYAIDEDIYIEIVHYWNLHAVAKHVGVTRMQSAGNWIQHTVELIDALRRSYPLPPSALCVSDRK